MSETDPRSAPRLECGASTPSGAQIETTVMDDPLSPFVGETMVSLSDAIEIIRAAWTDGWLQRGHLHNAPLGTRIAEKPKLLAEFLERMVPREG